MLDKAILHSETLNVVPFAWFGLQKGWEHGEDLAPIHVTLPFAASSAELSPAPCRGNANWDMSNSSLSFSAWTSFLIRMAKNNLCLLSKCCSCKIGLPLPTLESKVHSWGFVPRQKNDSSAVSRGFPEARFVCSYWGFSRKDDPKRKPWVVLTASIWVGCISRPIITRHCRKILMFCIQRVFLSSLLP